MDNVVLKVFDIIKSEYAVAPEDGELLYGHIKSAIDKGNSVEIDFSGIERLTTLFCNKSIAIWLKEHDSEWLNSKFSFSGLSTPSLDRLMRSIQIAKTRFAIDGDFEKSLDEELKDE